MKLFVHFKRHHIAPVLAGLALLLMPAALPAAPKPLLVYYMP